MRSLETDRLHIRTLNDTDYKMLYPLHSDAEVMKYIREPDQSVEQTKTRMEEMLEYSRKNPGLGLFPAFIKESDECVGWVLLLHAELDLSKEIEVGYRLFPQFWGQGIATELSKRMLKYAKERGLKKVCAVTRPDNKASRRVLEKAGLSYIDEREFYKIMCSYYEILL